MQADFFSFFSPPLFITITIRKGISPRLEILLPNQPEENYLVVGVGDTGTRRCHKGNDKVMMSPEKETLPPSLSNGLPREVVSYLRHSGTWN